MNMRRILIGILSLIILFSGSLAVEAAKTLPPGLVIGDSEGMYATSEGEYYIDLVGILPGEVYEKEITIRSLDLEDPFSLGLLVEEVGSTGSIFWKEHITLTLLLDEKEIYQGSILGDGSFDWSKTPLELGVCRYGTDKLLKARFTMDAHLTNDDLREQSKLEFYWTFVGTRDQPTEPPTPTQPSEPTIPSSPGGSGNLPSTGQGIPSNRKLLPQTGEQMVYMFLTGLLLVMIALFLWKKRREEEQE
ncbi:LPXTG cell wall anchor domain-containing protein [Enterococcus pallens]|uniref:LPXTG-domain-containing protein cell wall anchor domain n=1 Tax=Enterococcus pallens ATCC BAA-351 TaxID=1158607 RepID=R2QMA5_9ENTE|nr:LPXTG cell wall anchor domain-containing protein [Enterococcus pallens]EOH97702.1 LPXTG-domain-containing protein cell wall anchor domain [Enterococcus pallens ATCC BAA-351]EOU20879.1 hypothetical protein I588_01726 [Enterococcus pallens ATCC BAA-351]OJG75658.1 LPXTG-domain-containing protein cell wall anchor domain [Enterococcus pallens]